MARKTQFDLMRHVRNKKGAYEGQKAGDVIIVPKRQGQSGKKFPALVIIRTMLPEYYIQSSDLERFAVNILKVLGSKKLAFSQRYKAKTFFRKQKQ